jgi:hypothetical protein
MIRLPKQSVQENNLSLDLRGKFNGKDGGTSITNIIREEGKKQSNDNRTDGAKYATTSEVQFESGMVKRFALTLRDSLLQYIFEQQNSWAATDNHYAGYELTYTVPAIADWVLMSFDTPTIINPRFVNNTKFVADKQGTYDIGVYGRWESTTLTANTLYIQFAVQINNTLIFTVICGGTNSPFKAAGNTIVEINGSILIPLLAGEFVRIYARNINVAQTPLNTGDVSFHERRAWITYHGRKGQYEDLYTHVR